MAARGLATLIVSVDVDFPEIAWGEEFARLENATLELLERFNAYGIPATWGLTDVAHPLADEIIENTSHELALHVGASIIGSQRPRMTYVREMQRRLGVARLAGHVPTTLQLAAGCRIGHLDTLPKFGITAVRAAPVSASSASLWQQLLLAGRRGPIDWQPQRLRWGVWQFSSELVLPGMSLGAARRQIDRAIDAGRSIQMTIGAWDLMNRGPAAQATIDGVLKHAGRRCGEGCLTTLTIDQSVARLARPAVARRAGSILRRAA